MAEEEKQETEQKPVTKQDMVATIRKNQEKDFERRDYELRLRKLKRLSDCGHPGNNPLFGCYNPSLEYTHDELKALVPLDDDGKKYIKLATNRHGLHSIPRAVGRKNPHMNLKQQAIKSASIRIFKELFTTYSETLKATCKEQEIEYLGVPDAIIPELGAKAMRIAGRVVKKQNRARSKNHRRGGN